MKPIHFHIVFVPDKLYWKWTISGGDKPFVSKMPTFAFDKVYYYVRDFLVGGPPPKALPYFEIVKEGQFVQLKISAFGEPILDGQHRSGENKYEMDGSLRINLPREQLRGLFSYLQKLMGE